MYLNISKAFSLLKFKPPASSSLAIHPHSHLPTTFSIHQPINSFNDLALMDYLIGLQIRSIKSAISLYIHSIVGKDRKSIISHKGQLKSLLTTLVAILEKMEF